MSSIVNPAAIDAPLIRCEVSKARMAKAELPDFTIREKRAKYGKKLRRASEIAGLDRNQTADELKVDPAQISRWWSGDENPQMWRYDDCYRLRSALLIAEAEAHGAGVEVETTVRIKRTA